MKKLRVMSLELKVKDILRKLFTFNFSLLTSKRGFTLIEIIMIIVVVSIAIPALLILVGGEAGRGVESEIRVTATNVAKQLMEEIRSKRWDENSPIPPGTASTLGIDAGETAGDLSTYDDIDDYIAGAPDVSVGDVTYSRNVAVSYVNSDALNTTVAGPTDYKRIQITVTAPATNWNSSVVLTTVMSNY